jgi:tRNA A-37 threonylcarbamoyl transferase component Bud32
MDFREPDDTLLSLLSEACQGGSNWQIDVGSRPPRVWVVVRKEPAEFPNQGWKLHVSASIRSAEEVLRRALPIVLVEAVTFKITASVAVLAHLNAGLSGLSQVGKFMTIYPSDSAEAVRLAIALDEATQGLEGPTIPSDRPLRPGSLVHYRYGSFAEQYITSSQGVTSTALRTPDGDLIPDTRQPEYRSPDWAPDPFVAAGIVAEPATRSALFAGHYFSFSTLDRSPRGAVHLAADTAALRRCIVKQAYRHAMVDVYGRDARDRLRHEADILTQLASDPRFPTVLDLFEENSDLFLILNDIEGETLAQHVARATALGRFVHINQTITWGRQLAQALDAIHTIGFVHRDLKSSNIVLGPNGRLYVLDFDMAHELASMEPPFGIGTRGYLSLQQRAGKRPAVSDDVYSLGAILYLAATGAEPALTPDPHRLLARPLVVLNPCINADFAQVITRCLDPNPAARFPSMEALDEALAAINEHILPHYGAELTTQY